MGSHRFLRALFAALFALTVAACGGGSADKDFNGGDDGSGGGGGGGGGGTTTPTANALAITLPNGSQLAADADTVSEGLSLVALALDSSNQGVAGVVVTFTADSGEIAVTSATTDSTGRATAVLTTATNPNPRGIQVTVKDANSSATGSTTITVVPPVNSADPTPRLGTLNGSTFSQGAFTFQVSPLAAGGSSGFRIDIVDTANGNTVFTDPVNITFTSPCITAGTSVINPSAVVPNSAAASDGAVAGTYQARGCSGNDIVTARAVINGSAQTAQGAIVVQPSTLASVRFVSAIPINIGLRGSGLQETSTVSFQVVNASGGPIPNQTVNFALNTTLGGVSLSPASGTTDTAGNVSTVVTSGTVSTPVRVTATASSGGINISSQSEALTITTGLPDQNSFSLAAQCPNIEGLTINNTQAPILLLAADRYNNPVPDSTAVTFTTEGGEILGSCNMQGGACSVNFRSQDPRPLAYNGCDVGAPGNTDAACSVASGFGSSRAGRSSVLAFAVGEESFTDSDGDGLYDPGETFTDLSEAFLDEDEDGIRDTVSPIERIYDFDQSGSFNMADGRFNGLLCDNGSANIQCALPRTVHVRDSVTIVMSGSTPVINTAPGGPDVTVTGANSFIGDTIRINSLQTFNIAIVVRDVNKQPMAATTAVAFTASGDAGAIQGTSTFAVPCTVNDTAEGNTYRVAFKGALIVPPTPFGSSTLELRVSSPSGISTFYTFQVITSP